jgi:hypothetical protein
MGPFRPKWSNQLGVLGRADEVLQRFFRSASELMSEQKPDQAAPPPGREVEVSIEPDESAAFFGLRECHALVVDDSERHVNTKVDPA